MLFELEFDVVRGGAVVGSVLLDAPPFLLTMGDPGPIPWPLADPPCESHCSCHDVHVNAEAPAAAPAASGWRTAEEFCALIEAAKPAPSASRAEPAPDWAIPGVPRPPVGPSPLLASLTGALDELVAHGPLSGSRADTTALLSAAERTRALALRELAEMDAVGGHQVVGVKSTTASWLRDSRHLTDGAARATVGLAVALRDDLPFIGELLLTGAVSVEHAAAVRDGVRGLDAEAVTEAADGLVALARCTDPVDVRKRLRDKAHAINDRLAAAAERRARQRMGLRLSDVGSHTAVGRHAGRPGRRDRPAGDGPGCGSRPASR
jgi:hypothetical protein